MIEEIKEIDWPEGVTMSSATISSVDMGERTIQAQVKADAGVYNGGPLEVEWNDERFIMPLYRPQGNKDNVCRAATFDLTFRHWAEYQLQRFYFFTVQSVGSDTYIPDRYIASVSLTIDDFCELLGRVMNYWFGEAIKVRYVGLSDPEELPALMEISYSYIWDVIGKIYEVYGTRWKIVKEDDSYVLLVGAGGDEIDHIFEYGFNGGLLKVERQVQDDNIRNRLMGRGGSKNLPGYYFKQAPADSGFNSDPDWVSELENTYFEELRSKEFRDYVSGWKLAHEGYSQAEAEEAMRLREGNWAFEKGRTDSKFDPPEYVEDAESIDRYGLLLGSLENNEDIYPSIQGRTVEGLGLLDETVDVEQISEDVEIAESAQSDAQTTTVPGGRIYKEFSEVEAGSTITITLTPANGAFTVDEGYTGNFDIQGLGVEVRQMFYGAFVPITGTGWELQSSTVKVYDYKGSEVSATGLTEGSYSYSVEVKIFIKNTFSNLRVFVSVEGGKLTTAQIVSDEQSGKTFNVWIKNIWDSSKGATESDAEYVDRIWGPILGDGEDNEAKLIFSSGLLSISEDYEFRIIKVSYDVDKELNGVKSHWCLTLEKSDAELETTGLYIPSSRMNGAAGDRFFFTGIELPHRYVLLAEEDLQNYKLGELGKVSDIQPMWVVGVDRVRANDIVGGRRLRDWLTPGATLRLSSPFRNGEGTEDAGAYELLYVQGVTLTFREPSDSDAALNPDIELTLGTDYAGAVNPVATLQGSIDALTRRVGALGDLEQLIRAVGDNLYLRKDGISDRSVSPTEFANLLTSYGFRQGMIGGHGWGFYRDANGNWVLEIDRLKARQDFEVTNLVVSQIEARGGMIVESAAAIEVTAVEELDRGYVCYFDTKGGGVANRFVASDIGMCHRFNPATEASPAEANSGDQSGYEKFYKRRVLSVGTDYIVLYKTGSYVNAPEGAIPAVGDVIVQYGNYTDATRMHVIVRDVVGGGYERFIEGLNSVNTDGQEYYFVGKQQGSFGSQARFFLGNDDNYISYENGELIIKACLSVKSTIGDKLIDEYIESVIPDEPENLATGTGMERSFIPWSSDEQENYILCNVSGLVKTDTVRVSFDYSIDGIFQQGDTSKGIYIAFGQEYGYKPILRFLKGEEHENTDGYVHFESEPFVMGDGTNSDYWANTTEETESVIYLRFFCCLGGEFKIRNIMVVKGDILPDKWGPSPKDTGTLYKALSGNTTISGGLVLTSMVETGEWNSLNQFVTRAGISGISDPNHANGGVVFWGGGTYQQAAEGTSTYVIYMDGTGHAAGGVIQFKEDRLQVGGIIGLSDDGLEMSINGERKMALGNYEVTERKEYVMTPKTLAPFPTNDSNHAAVQNQYDTEKYIFDIIVNETENSSGYGIMNFHLSGDREPQVLKSGTTGKILAGSVITLSGGSGSANGYFSGYRLVTSYIQGLGSANVIIRHWIEDAGTGSVLGRGDDLIPEIQNSYVVWPLSYFRWVADKDYPNGVRYCFELINNGNMPEGDTYTDTISAVYSGPLYVQTVAPTYNKTELGSDGLMFSWGNSNQFQTDGYWGARVGDYGIKVLNDGIYILRSGYTVWEKISLDKIV